MAAHEVEVALNWFGQRQGKVGYSMTNRLGPNSYDCSSSVYFALRAGGIFPDGLMGWTGKMFTDLPAYGWEEVPAKADGTIDAQRGDIFLWLISGSWTTPGGGAHTGMFIDPDNIIHCNYLYGISVNNHDAYYTQAGVKALRIFRYKGKKAPQRVVTFNKPFRAEQFATVNGIHQAKLAGIVNAGFDWTDNGIPSKWLTKLDEYEGEVYKINGSYKVLEEAIDLGVKYLRIEAGEFGSVWVWEQALNNPENFILKKKEEPKVEPPKVEEPKKKPTKKEEPKKEEPKKEEPKKEELKKEEPKKEEGKMEEANAPIVLTKEQIMAIENFESENNAKLSTEYTPTISKKTKDKVYFIADIGIALLTATGTISAAISPANAQMVFAIAGALSGFLATLKVIFKISSTK